MRRPRLVDRVLARLGLQRIPVHRSVYQGAQYSRLTTDWFAKLLSSDQEVKSSLRTLRARSRQLVRDNPHAAAAIAEYTKNVVGHCGIAMQSRVEKVSGARRKNTNDAIEGAWQEWGYPEYASVDRRLSWVGIKSQAVATMAIDGEAFLRMRPRAIAQNPFAFALQFLDADQLDESFGGRADNGNLVRMGIEVDGDNAPVAYHFWNRHPTDPSSEQRKRIRIPAEEIIHLGLPMRPNQTRYLPWLTPVLFRLNMLDGYEEAEITAARTASANPVFFEVDPDAADVYGDTGKPTQPITLDIEPGVGTQLPVGLKANQLSPEHPTTAFEPFQKAILRAIAKGVGLSYPTLSGDLREVNFSSQRVGLFSERDAYRVLQQHLICYLCRPVFREWLKLASLAGAVQLPTADVPRWMAPTWQPRGWANVQPREDAEAAVLLIKNGMDTRTRLLAERGLDYEEVVKQLAEEQEIAAELGVTIDSELSLSTQGATDGPGQGAGGAAGDALPADDAGAAAPGRDGEPGGFRRNGHAHSRRALVGAAG